MRRALLPRETFRWRVKRSQEEHETYQPDKLCSEIVSAQGPINDSPIFPLQSSSPFALYDSGHSLGLILHLSIRACSAPSLTRAKARLFNIQSWLWCGDLLTQ
ncbi:hypothetical protein FOPG_00329 [Fusarium oxysporum f. sp. conglutinans race 2 54008]|uniref:Uncharacterized protein n=1 Tax=Fusarium oxysporum f. sp. conglutinans race 2 54008 TaxID=1089457 RepID=X0JV72_FUSOX|nr:hypothetical protein FOPG_00329 [Fusarium oxysporum f. sp. conglutinans race 2 54008]